MSEVYNVSGKISEDINDAVKFLSEKLNCDRPGGPQAFFTLCKRMNLCYEMDHPNDTFTVYYSLPEGEKEEVETVTQETEEEPQIDEEAPTEPSGDDPFDDFF